MVLTAQASGGASGGGGFALEQSGLRRATLVCEQLHHEVPVHFNPTQVTVVKGVIVRQPHQRGAETGSNPQWVNTRTRTLKLSLILDAWTSGRNVADDTMVIQSWMNPTPASQQAGTPEPPIVEFDWNGVTTFPGYLMSATAVYNLFDSGGVPLRATLTLDILEVPEKLPGTNPTSGGEPGQRTRLVREGETLQSVAFDEYGDASLWRSLALANAIDDPLRLAVGARLEVPPQLRAQELRR
jgi:nucleoid-associated protein YgaU